MDPVSDQADTIRWVGRFEIKILVHKADISGADAFNENEFDEIEHPKYCDWSQLWRYVFGIISQRPTSQFALVPPLS